MFDPTANSGSGHWQLMNEFPPRKLASLASVDYATRPTGTVAHRSIMFGGETGLHTPKGAWQPAGPTSRYFVAPTLGDTWMYDHDTQSWHRVKLLGKGYNDSTHNGSAFSAASEVERRQAYDATQPGVFHDNSSNIDHDLGLHVSELSPPPLSGAILVTRTMSATLQKLKIPEVFLLGGRKKDGSFISLDRVYKFCAGSTGEAFAHDTALSATSYPNDLDYSCDAYDSETNAESPSPSSDYVGRWLRKEPDGDGSIDPTLSAAFMGGAAYDSSRDRILLFGGLAPATGAGAVTDTSNLVANEGGVLEYTPPQPQLISARPREGRWAFIPSCTTSSSVPAGRYGHTVAYDALHQSLAIVGGYDVSGNPLTSTLTYPDGRTYTSPEVWTASYDHEAIGNTPCYSWKKLTEFGNSIDIAAQKPPLAGVAHAAAVFIPSTGYNSGFYSMFDNACAGQGPIATADPAVSKLLAGGAYIDLDRSALGTNENLLLNLTYIPLGSSNLRPDSNHFTAAESAVLRVHMIKTGQTQSALQNALQPRHLTYADTNEFPQVAQSIAVMAPPTGQITQEQILLPLSTDPLIDRIRIERYSGSAILLDAALYRMGNK
jgi:hypothetical protein